MTYPYITRQTVGGTGFNFAIADDVARAWYDTPSKGACDLPLKPFIPDRDKSTNWPEMDIMREHIALPGSTVIDCGCHHGLTTVLLAGWVGKSGFVHAFDAVLENAYITKQNLLHNQISNASAYCAGIGASFGFASMANESNVVLTKPSFTTSQTTIVVKLSSFFQEAAPDAIKIDIEGFELDMLRAERDFISRIPRVAIEVHTDYLPQGGAHELASILDRPIFVLDGGGSLNPYNKRKKYADRCHFFCW